MTISSRETDAACDAIGEATAPQLARLLRQALVCLGEFGREGAEALLAEIQRSPEPNIEEGLAQIAAVEGVFTGRTDSL
jgi:hypothetical protein